MTECRNYSPDSELGPFLNIEKRRFLIVKTTRTLGASRSERGPDDEGIASGKLNRPEAAVVFHTLRWSKQDNVSHINNRGAEKVDLFIR